MFVYIIVNHVANKIYIGKTITENLQKYLREKLHDARTDQYQGRSHLFRAMKKYQGPEDWSIYPLISTLTTNEDLCFYERVLIAQYDSQNPDVGYNICRGGEGFTGTKSEDSKGKNRKNSLQTWRDPEIRARRIKNQRQVRDERGGSFLTKNSITKIKSARALQDEPARLAGWETNKGNAGKGLSHEAHVLGGKAGSRADKQRAGRLGAARGMVKAQHVRWHVNRGQMNPECSLCRLSPA
jgi:hypothetical protein